MGAGRPSMEAVQRRLIIVVLAGLVFGCILGTLFGTYYAWQVNPATYAGGAFPDELSSGYQNEYVKMATDSYIVNRQVNLAQERLKTFDTATKVRQLGERSATFVANGQAVEAQLVNELALNLKNAENWDQATVENEIAALTSEYQSDSARAQAINTFSAQLLGAVPAPVEGEGAAEQPAPEEGAAGQPPAEGEQAEAPAPAAPAPEASFPWGRTALGCLILLGAIIAAVLLIGRWQFGRSSTQSRNPEVEWEGEGPPPLRIWSGTYTSGQNNYDEFFTIETDEGDFLGESGMGIMKAIPGTTPKQVTAFDVGLFDKTDITTLSRVVMSQHAFEEDVELRNSIEANPQAEAILAEPGKEFTLETTAMRVVATIDELEYGGENNEYFEKLKVTLQVFLREGVDLRVGEMDVPQEYQGT